MKLVEYEADRGRLREVRSVHDLEVTSISRTGIELEQPPVDYGEIRTIVVLTYDDGDTPLMKAAER